MARDCCVSGVKTSVAERPPPSTVLPGKLEVMPKPFEVLPEQGKVPSKPDIGKEATLIPQVEGQWVSHVGVVYEFTQSGTRFSWTVATLNEKGEGTISGLDVSASWKGNLGYGSATGRITKVDSKGRATRIEWSNGVIFSRK